MFPTGAEQGKRIIIGGCSPYIAKLPKNELSKYPVIGINRWPDFHHCDYWIGLDTGLNWEKYYLDTNENFKDLPKFLRTLDCPKFMRKPNRQTEKFMPEDAGIYFKSAENRIPLVWDGTLRWESSTAMAAINLAIIMGAAEVVLWGVDFVGNGRIDGVEYPFPDFWEDHREVINRLLKEFQEHVTIYRTHPDSWLECPLMEIDMFDDLTEQKLNELAEDAKPVVSDFGPPADDVEPEPEKESESKSEEPKENVDDKVKPEENFPEKEAESEENKDGSPCLGEGEHTSASEKAKYEKAWEIEQYRVESPGVRNLPRFFDKFNPGTSNSVADFGCGTGKASLMIREKGVKVKMVDITETALNPEVKANLQDGYFDFIEASLWEMPEDFEQVDYGYCVDVMEHLPEEKVDAVLDMIQAKCKEGVYFAIALYQDSHFANLVGEYLHLTVKDAQWWFNKLNKRWATVTLDVTPIHVKLECRTRKELAQDGTDSTTEDTSEKAPENLA